MCLNLLLLDTGTSDNYTIIKFIFVKTASKTTEFKSYSPDCSIGQALLKKTRHHIHNNSLHILVITLKAHTTNKEYKKLLANNFLLTEKQVCPFVLHCTT